MSQSGPQLSFATHGLLALPADLWPIIFSYLSPKERLNLESIKFLNAKLRQPALGKLLLPFLDRLRAIDPRVPKTETILLENTRTTLINWILKIQQSQLIECSILHQNSAKNKAVALAADQLLLILNHQQKNILLFNSLRNEVNSWMESTLRF